MTAGLFLALLLSLSLLLWIVIRQRQENILNSTVIAATNCSVLVTDATVPHHPIIYANPAFLLLTGHAEQEVVGQTMSILTGPDTDRASIEKLAMAVQDGWACRVRLCQYRKNGTSFLSDVSLSPVKDRLGRMTSVVWTMSEMPQLGQDSDEPDQIPSEGSADCRRAEPALWDSETRLDLAVEAGQVGFFEHDQGTASLVWSPTLRSIYGVGADEPASWQRYLELVHPDDLDRMVCTVGRICTTTGGSLYEIEHRLVRPNGSMRHIRLRSLTLFDGEGSLMQPLRTLGTVVDVTDRKHVETRRRETARIEAIGTFAGGIAHELNNGFTAVLGFSELALPLIPVESKAHRHIRQVIVAAKKSRELIQQLMAFSGQHDQGRCPLVLHSLAKESLRFLRPTIPLWVELKTQIAHATNPISANAVQMHEMIFNLVDHALRAMEKTGGTLDVQLQNREFLEDQTMPLGRLSAGQYVRLSVRAVGDGMGQEGLNRLVDSFVRPKIVGEAQDVGLAAVYDIVTAHGGTLTVESHIGIGTTVSVYLPAISSCAPSMMQKDDTPPHGHECILFVDDEDAVVRFGREVLESLGYYPVVCRTAAEALEVFQADPKRFDLLITDRTMPGMSGDRLAQVCRELRPDLSVIVCSGSLSVPGLNADYSQGVSECLLKPLTLNELAHAIRRALNQSPVYSESMGAQTNSGPEPSRISIEVSNAVGPRG